MALPVRTGTACFLKRNGKTLFIDYTNHRHPVHFGKYAPPGGRMEKEDKTPEDCIRREVMEEQGIILRDIIYRGRVKFLNGKRTVDGQIMHYDFDVDFYDCFDFDDSRANAKEGVPVWVEDNLVLEQPLHEGDKVIWRDWLSSYKVFNGIIEQEGEKLASARLTSGTPIS